MRNKITQIFCLVFVLCTAAVAYAATLTSSKTGTGFSTRGTWYVTSIPVSGAPAATVNTTNVQWNWDLMMPLQAVTPGGGVGVPTFEEYPQPSGLQVKLCWWAKWDGPIFILSMADAAGHCKDISGQKTGSTSFWNGFGFNNSNGQLAWKIAFLVPGSGSFSPVVNGSNTTIYTSY
jgi:hypothetical protein